MNNKKFVKKFFFFLIFTLLIFIIYLKFFKNDKNEVFQEETNETVYHSNLIEDVEYSTKDKDGNEYLIKAQEGEIDFSNSNIIFLKKVKALIKLNNSEEVVILSDFGKYNSESYDTIFSKNVIINYLDNKITAEYLDFSLIRNLIIISKDVIYISEKNTLNADVVEINIKTKDTKIFMHEKKKKIKIKNKS